MKRLFIIVFAAALLMVSAGCSGEENKISIPEATEALYTDSNGVGYNLDVDGNLTTASFKNKKKNIVIPEKYEGKSVTSVGKSTFKMSGAESVAIPDSVTEIKDYAFAFSRYLEKVTIPESVKVIGTNAFSGCSMLTSVKLPKKLEEIGMYSFDASGLKEITIPKSVKTVGEYAFAECKNLKKVTFKGKKTKIADTAFSKSENVKFVAPMKSKAADFAKANAIECKSK